MARDPELISAALWARHRLRLLRRWCFLRQSGLQLQVKMKIESKDVSGASTLTPIFTERTISGTARVQNNRTMMLASVSQDIQSTGRQGLPILSGLPVLGRFFTSPTRDNRQVDIVI